MFKFKNKNLYKYWKNAKAQGLIKVLFFQDARRKSKIFFYNVDDKFYRR